MKMINLSEKLLAAGVNWQEIMERFVEDEEFYESCLRLFMEDNTLARLQEALRQENFADAFAYAHTLKGVSSNLGLTCFSSAVRELIEALRNKNYTNLEVQYKSVLDEREKLIAIMNN